MKTVFVAATAAILALGGCAANGGFDANQGMNMGSGLVKTMVDNQCRTELNNRNEWRVVALAMTAQKQREWEDKICGCASEEAPQHLNVNDMAAMLKEAAPVLHHVRVADTYNHKASSQLRYIVNPPGSNVRVHQHLDIGQGEIDWDLFFKTLGEIKFDGVLSSCVFAWEDRAEDSSRFMRTEIQRYLDKYR